MVGKIIYNETIGPLEAEILLVKILSIRVVLYEVIRVGFEISG